MRSLKSFERISKFSVLGSVFACKFEQSVGWHCRDSIGSRAPPPRSSLAASPCRPRSGSRDRTRCIPALSSDNFFQILSRRHSAVRDAAIFHNS